MYKGTKGSAVKGKKRVQVYQRSIGFRCTREHRVRVDKETKGLAVKGNKGFSCTREQRG